MTSTRQSGGITRAIYRPATAREFGYQLTFFRRALSPPTEAQESHSEDSAWRTNQLYFAHFTISDINDSRFYQQEKFSRGAAGLAGAAAEPYHVWIEDWAAEEIAPGVVRLTAQSGTLALDLQLTQTLPPILHGDGGLSQKGPEVGNASYYYSFVQQPTTGTIRLGDETWTVAGLSWKDHEYSTSALTRDAVGWDWFSAQLENGAALMMGQIRQADGRVNPTFAGTFVSAEGTTVPLAVTDIQLSVTDEWRSPTTNISYPAGWRIVVDKVGLELTAVPLMPNQELTLSSTYWEGAVAYDGTVEGEPISGRGYVELTGYGEP
ncbi:MAG: hypothetical protein HC804_07480 [Anaerolineae bacterium]|nr:hypothetical protein [Anaerolineae bacterium]